jgi:asparagine synthase (glutamine-hydrolysing)
VKSGFSIPLDRWLRGPLREWAESLLEERRVREDGFFQAFPIRKKWAEHLSGKSAWHHQLWSVLMFQAWWDVNRQIPAVAAGASDEHSILNGNISSSPERELARKHA